MSKEHRYTVTVRWTGNLGKGTETYRAYARDHEILGGSKPLIPGSSDPAFRGDPSRYNPEDLLVASLSGCHMLWYLHLCADARIIVTEYVDDAYGILEETAEGGGWFTRGASMPRLTACASSPTPSTFRSTTSRRSRRRTARPTSSDDRRSNAPPSAPLPG
jgi:organic hydroperoxide reductase OsmC/OhrA